MDIPITEIRRSYLYNGNSILVIYIETVLGYWNGTAYDHLIFIMEILYWLLILKRPRVIWTALRRPCDGSNASEIILDMNTIGRYLATTKQNKMQIVSTIHDDVIKWKHFPRYWPFVRGNHRPPVNSPHKGQWRGTLMFSFICAWINGRINNRDAGDLRRHRAHYDVIVMYWDVLYARMSRKRFAIFVSFALFLVAMLIHWGRVTHICMSELCHHCFS